MMALPIAWPCEGPRRAGHITSAVLVASQLVTESAQLPGTSHVNLAFGHPVTFAVAIWVGLEFLRSVRDHRGWDEERLARLWRPVRRRRPGQSSPRRRDLRSLG